MDFGALLGVAKKNSESGKSAEGKYYSTKFSAPKKESKEKKLSENIKKFLAKKEAEEREKAREEKKKRDELLAMRDEKSKNKIKKMLKVIKSANKSVLEDAIDRQNTAVTLHAGPDQPDVDDYGYVSTEAAAFYQKYMDKVKTLPDEKKFAPSRPQMKGDLSGTKDRVKAALIKEQEELNNPVRTKSSTLKSGQSVTTPSVSGSSTSRSRKDIFDPQAEREMEEQKRRDEEQKKATKFKKPLPPPMDFQQLMKLAEKKQHEPVEIHVEAKKEPERLLTKSQKKEMEERKAYLEGRERRRKEAQMRANGKIPKVNGTTSTNDQKKDINVNRIPKVGSSQNLADSDGIKSKKLPVTPKPTGADQRLSTSNINHTKIRSVNTDAGNNKQTLPPHKTISTSVSKTESALPIIKQRPQQVNSNYSGPSRGLSQKKPMDERRPPLNKDIKTRQFPPADIRTREFPPSSVKNSKQMKKPPPKRRILDDDDSEYDSELDDFIDDGPEESENYSSYIKEIFGYDKSRYRDIDDGDDAGMESNFAQISKEEAISKRMGMLEDLEDMRIEAEEKKKKALKKRKLK